TRRGRTLRVWYGCLPRGSSPQPRARDRAWVCSPKTALATAPTPTVLRARPLHHRMQQHVAAGGDVLGLGVFDLVVADAVFAGNEDHAAGRQLGHVDRVVAGAG